MSNPASQQRGGVARGRGLKRGRWAARADSDGATVRVEDESNPETWVEFYLTLADLQDLAVQVSLEGLASGSPWDDAAQKHELGGEGG